MRNPFLLLILITSVSFAQVRNVQLDSFDGSPVGYAIGAHINNKAPGTITAYVSGTVYTSTDSGRTFTPNKLPELPGVASYQAAADPKGNFYYYYASPTDDGDRIHFSKSTDGGKKWSEVSSLPGGKGKSTFMSLSSHQKKDELMFVWTQTEEGENNSCISNVYVTVSHSGGKKWDDPIQINNEPGDCSGKGKFVQPSRPLLGRDGKIFIVWSGNEKIFIDRSYDGGNLWIKTDLPVGEQVGGWDMVIPGAKGASQVPAVAIDNTEFRTTGTLYIAYADQKNGATDTDVWLIRSPNHGDNWTYPERVNHDEPGKYQYSPRVAVDQATGFVYIVYFDRRNYSDEKSDVYLAWSADAGSKIQELKVNDLPIAGGEVPPLLSVSAHKGVIAVLWTATEAGKTAVRGAIINQNDLK